MELIHQYRTQVDIIAIPNQDIEYSPRYKIG